MKLLPTHCKKNIIVFGGTSDAVEFCDNLNKYQKNNFNIIYSIAGITKKPNVPKNTKLKIGGFGNQLKFEQYLKKNKIDFVVDATHPFAIKFKKKLYKTCVKKNIKYFTILRIHWKKKQDDIWLNANNYFEINEYLKKINLPTLFSIGNKNIEKINQIPKNSIARMKSTKKIKNLTIIKNLGFKKLEQEIIFFTQNNIQCLVTKNSGGEKTYNKIIAARKLKIPVIMLKNPKMNVSYNHKSGMKNIMKKLIYFNKSSSFPFSSNW